ncbi:MAG: 3-hydroxybutyryl-CoA dehydrogenase [Anaerovoracaceae bacterium]|jgi:3-hydroxybutyryl-CoA dehydrogenase|nr:3-hydroxybutyryl-CoA dehydrogenase [Bacillota bacterium]MDY2670817.1 3-hydroxybutyryl-CoA dehydrogenase [Anaerovoracaceae bacterium]
MEFKKIGILGASTMGAGLVQHIANCGYEVVFRARKQTSIDSAIQHITGQYDFMISRGWLAPEKKEENLARIKGTTDIEALADADFIIEAASENMDIKKDIFRQLDKICRPEVILSSNTSSLSITEIASVTSRPGRVVGMHFFNPAPVMKLVEVVPGYNTSDETIDVVKKVATELQKTPIVVNEAPGFVVNRMLVPMINECVGVLAENIASAEDIDRAMQLGANHPMGPLALADLIGLDVCLSIMEVLHKELGEDKYRPHPLLRKMVRAGKLGQKTGEGFYKYNNK